MSKVAAESITVTVRPSRRANCDVCDVIKISWHDGELPRRHWIHVLAENLGVSRTRQSMGWVYDLSTDCVMHVMWLHPDGLKKGVQPGFHATLVVYDEDGERSWPIPVEVAANSLYGNPSAEIS